MKRVLFFTALVVGVLFPSGVYAADITIGTGTINGNSPMGTSYYTERIQSIYLASEIGSAKTLTSLALNVMTMPGQTLTNFTIRLKHTDLSAYQVNSKWDFNGWTTVYQANQTVYGTGWSTFTFTTPFSYNGVQNLIVDFSFNNTSSSTAGYCQFSTLGTRRSLFYNTSSSNGNPLAWSGYTPTPSTSVNFLNLRLGYLDFGTGSGTAADPYQIWTPEQFSAIGPNSGNWNKYYILMADLDMQGVALTPIGNSATAFTGSFNGNKHIIRNATINVSGGSRVGIFAYVGSGAKVSNLGVESAAIAGQSSVGILAGSNYGTLTNCYTTGIVTGTSSNLGGLAGVSVGTVLNCYTMASVSGGTSSSYVGGLVGNVSGGTVINCYAAGTSTGGGLIGYRTSGTVTGCFWDAEAAGKSAIAGCLGWTTAQMQDINTYLLARWDFDFESINGVQNIWTISPGQYPRFIWQPGAPEDIAVVPGVKLLTKTAAESAIVAAGLTVWVTNVYSDTVTAGTVISQSPAVDTPLIAGMPVNISVSLGPKIDGSGTEADPSRIGTIADWQAFMNGSFGWTNCILIADLDLRFVTLTPVGNSSSMFKGFFNGNGHIIRNATLNAQTVYLGLFGYTDTSARIGYLGLESVIVTAGENSYAGGLVGLNYGTIYNCYAAGTVTGTSLSLGALVGSNNGIIEQCYAGGYVGGTPSANISSIGGLVGYNYATMNHCYATTLVLGNSGSSIPCRVGGLVGGVFQSSISQCYATGNVTGFNIGNPCYVGGLVGYIENGGVSQCYATGAVTGNSVNGGIYVGGLVGYGGSINNCYATGSVSWLNGTNTIGGLVGSNAAVSNSYSIGSVITSPAFTGGGLAGLSTTVYDGFWDIQTSGRIYSGGGTGKTTEQMQTLSTFIDAGWDFAGEMVNGTEDIWTISSAQYPRLAWQGDTPPAMIMVPNVTMLTETEAQNVLTAAGFTLWVTHVYSDTAAAGTVIKQSPAAGTTLQEGMAVNISVSLGIKGTSLGTEAYPYKIGTVQDWRSLMLNTAEWGKYYILIADLDLRYAALTPVGNSTTAFSGSFNGNGHVIRNATMKVTSTSSNYTGLFGVINSAGRVFDLELDSLKITGTYYVGGLAGSSAGTITDCYVSGEVVGTNYVGGLLGYNSGTVGYCSAKGSVGNGSGPYTGGLIGYIYQGTVSDCDAASTVAGISYSGGLAGYNAAGKISKCYSTGIIKTPYLAGSYHGGLVGFNVSGSIEQCYSTGSVCLRTMQGTPQYVGGLAGYNETGKIKNCYSTGAIGGASYFGGFVASNGGAISQCYSTGFVNVQSQSGGFCGPNTGTIAGCFWDTQTSGKTLSGGGSGVQGKTTAQMKTFSTFESPGWTAGRSGDALLFDGVNDYVVVAGYNGISGSHARTVSVWFKTSAPVWQTGGTMPSTMSLVQWGRDDTTLNGLWMVALNGNRKACILVGNTTVSGSNALNDGQWHNLVAILQEGGTVPVLYVDGILDSHTSVFPIPFVNTDTENMPVHIGAHGYYNNGTRMFDYYAQAFMDDVRIYNRSLSAGEVVPDNLPVDGLAARWAMDETEGTVAHDSVSSYDGQLKNLGWDFVGETANGTDDIWFMWDGKDYPRLAGLIEIPMANAGADQTVYARPGGIAAVTLNGAGFSGVAGVTLAYKWYEGQTLLAEGINPVVSLPVGIHTITLVVSDGIEESEPDVVVVTVVGPLVVPMMASPFTLKLSTTSGYVMAMMDLPKGSTVSQLNMANGFYLLPGDIKAYDVRCVQYGYARVMAIFEWSKVRNYLQPGRVTLTLYGRLTSGQYVCGSTTLPVVN